MDTRFINCPIIILLFLTLAGCQDDVKYYRGQIIELDFNYVENIQPGSWIKIDEWKLTHVRSLKEGNETDLSLPTDYVEIHSSESQDEGIGTRVNPRHIGLHIGRNLKEINNNRLPEDAPRYTIPNPEFLSAAGILKIAKTDSSNLTITVPKNYPIPIKILE